MVRLTNRLGMGAGDWPWVGYSVMWVFAGWYFVANPDPQTALLGVSVALAVFALCFGVSFYVLAQTRAEAKEANTQTSNPAEPVTSKRNRRLRIGAFAVIGVIAGLLKLWTLSHHG